MSDQVFRVLLRMEVRPGQGPEFERVWTDSAATITDQEANLGQWLSRSLDEEGVYYIVSDWLDEARFRAYEQTEEHRQHRSRLHPFRSTGSMVTMQVLRGLTGAGQRS
jgi:heme-degrading monooxygenase HmoA